MIDLLISCAGLRRMPDWLPWNGPPPVLLEWPGTPTRSGHASWKRAAAALRDRDGALLPNLLKHYRQFIGADLSGVSRIAVIGFSAGSNSGVRELLRSALDRSMLSFVVCVDGLHPMLSSRPSSGPDPEGLYADWAGQVAPFASFALEAAQSTDRAMVCTASEVRPASSVAPTALALASLYQWTSRRAPGAPFAPPAFPPRSDSDVLRPGETYPRPFNVLGAGNFACLWYAGQDERAHQLQAWIAGPDVLRSWLVPLWGGAAPMLASFDWPPPAPQPPERSSARGLPDWTPAALGAIATVATAFV